MTDEQQRQLDREQERRVQSAAFHAAHPEYDSAGSAGRTSVCAHGVRAPHECKECADEPSDAVIALQRIHDFADAAHTKDDGHCFALSEIVAMCRAALDRVTSSAS